MRPEFILFFKIGYLILSRPDFCLMVVPLKR